MSELEIFGVDDAVFHQEFEDAELRYTSEIAPGYYITVGRRANGDEIVFFRTPGALHAVVALDRN